MKSKVKKRAASKKRSSKSAVATGRMKTVRPKRRKTPDPRYSLRLYVTGQTPRSLRSVENLRAICDQHLPGRCDLEVVDIYQQPAMAAEGQIIAAPTLIKFMPLPLRRLVGDLSDQARVIVGLDIKID